MAKVSPLMLAPPLIFAALAGLFVWGMGREDPNAMPTAYAGRMAPTLAVTPLGAHPTVTDAVLRDGTVKLVNFWASWCGPCRVEHPALTALAAEGLTIYGINYKDDPAKAEAFLAELGNPYAGLSAIDGRGALEWGITGVPETFVIAGDGTVITRYSGPLTERSIASDIRPALAKAAAAPTSTAAPSGN
ncbi:DsbE family thiol:disulfide interchange protein [Paracoccus sp. p4-l81]|uniref:DsbE family thiol:disulfide interchange protein n=1 Tax=Paracoccus sp. p4-l81 TaxID=3342806 RepID=UPI0035B6F4B4